MMEHTFFQKVQIWLIELMASIHWRQKDSLSDENKAALKKLFAENYYVIASRKDNQLSTFAICFGHWFLTGKWGYYSHVLMNLEDEVKNDDDFRFIEATSQGVGFNTFNGVFDPCYAAALIVPKNMTVEEWTAALDRAKTFLGRPYDNLFDLKNDLEINCVELVRLALQGLPDYATKFAEFEKMVAARKKLTPQMFLECPDFTIAATFKR